MVKIILLLVYLTGGGELKIEKQAFDAQAEAQCTKAGRARIEKLFENDPAIEGIFAGCVLAKVTDV